MFRDKYKKEMDSVHAPDNAVAKAMAVKKPRKTSYMSYKRYIAIAAALVILFGCVSTIPVFLSRPSTLPEATAPENAQELHAMIVQRLEVLKRDSYQFKNSITVNGVVWGDAWLEDDVEEDLEVEVEAFAPTAPAPEADKGESNSPEFSDVNNQVDGVQEADVIRTDGKNIYTCASSYEYDCSYFNVIAVEDGNMVHTASVKLDASYRFKDIILLDGKIILVGSTYHNGGSTLIYVYGLDEQNNAVMENRFVQSGNLVSVRESDSTLYVVSLNHNSLYRTYATNEELTVDEITDQLPYAGESSDDCLDFGDIYVPAEVSNSAFTVVSALNIHSGESASTAVFGSGTDIYADNDTIYVYGSKYKETEFKQYENHTLIFRISIADEKPALTGTAIVLGSVLNNYSMDEYNGMLRIALTRRSDNAVVVLDSELKQIGEVDGIGINEHIKSVRFSGELVYLVTFRTTDPLYAIDLSDPANPTVRSELKIPGYSGYMQQYGEGLLFGFGYEADVNTGITTGLKMSMFDNSDPDALSEKHTLILEDCSYLQVFEDITKAISVRPEKNLIFFPYRFYDDKGEHCVFALYTYTENGFELIGSHTLINEDCWDISASRGMYIGDYLYEVHAKHDGGVSVYSYTLSDFTPVGTLE